MCRREVTSDPCASCNTLQWTMMVGCDVVAASPAIAMAQPVATSRTQNADEVQDFRRWPVNAACCSAHSQLLHKRHGQTRAYAYRIRRRVPAYRIPACWHCRGSDTALPCLVCRVTYYTAILDCRNDVLRASCHAAALSTVRSVDGMPDFCSTNGSSSVSTVAVAALPTA